MNSPVGGYYNPNYNSTILWKSGELFDGKYLDPSQGLQIWKIGKLYTGKFLDSNHGQCICRSSYCRKCQDFYEDELDLRTVNRKIYPNIGMEDDCLYRTPFWDGY